MAMWCLRGDCEGNAASSQECQDSDHAETYLRDLRRWWEEKHGKDLFDG